MTTTTLATQTTTNDFDTLLSRDGAKIGYYTLGYGPGLVLLSGGNHAAKHYMRLASHLARTYTVYVVERRGRPLSDPYSANHTIEKEVDDVMALLDRTGARFVFGHSSGAAVALNVARDYHLSKVAAYEPPLVFPTHWVTDFERRIHQDDYVGANIVLMKGLEVGGSMSVVPTPLLKTLFTVTIRGEALEEIKQLLPTMSTEARALMAIAKDSQRYTEVRAETLLLLGGKSPAYIHRATSDFENLIPHAYVELFKDLDHSGPLLAPLDIAQSLREFFV